MQISLVKLAAVFVLFSTTSCKHRQSAASNASSTSGDSQALEKFDFYDDEGYPIERTNFSLKETPNCIAYGAGELDEDIIHSREYAFYTFESESGTRTAYQATYENGNCEGKHIDLYQGSKSFGKVQWKKVDDYQLKDSDGSLSAPRKVLFSSDFKIVDFGDKVCLLSGADITSDPLFCTIFVYNRLISKDRKEK